MDVKADDNCGYRSIAALLGMGNNASCKIASIGTIQIKMFDGVIHIHGDVMHVLDLKRNLISLCTLDSKGYKYTSEGGVMKCSGCDERYAKVREIICFAWLYILGDVVFASHSLSDDDVTKLWHLCLGHMSENGMA